MATQKYDKKGATAKRGSTKGIKKNRGRKKSTTSALKKDVKKRVKKVKDKGYKKK